MDVIFQGENGIIRVTNLILTDKVSTGECVLRPVGSGTWVARGFRTDYEALSTDSGIARIDSGKTYSNDGAVATVTVSLPFPQVPGVAYNFVRVASQLFRVNPSSLSSVIYSSGQLPAGNFIQLEENGAKITLVSDNNNNWISTYEFGEITPE